METPTVRTLTLELPLVAARPNPGQFYMVWLPGYEEIPLSPSDCDSSGGLSFTIKAIGPTTQRLISLKPGETLAIRGPYGKGYHLDFNPPGKELLLVGGGSGVAPLFYAASTMHKQDAIFDVLLGSKTASELLFINAFKSIARSIELTTDDGSAGHTGLITDLLQKKVDENHNYVTIIVCGPEPMLAQAMQILDRTNYHYQLSLHRIMKCGVGICGSCAIKGVITCREGPVLLRNQTKDIRDELGRFTRTHDGAKEYFKKTS